MSIADELEKLQRLHESGALTDEEFAKAKQLALSGMPPPRTAGGNGEGLLRNLFDSRDQTLGRAANRYVSFQIVMAVIGIVLVLLFFIRIFLPHWNRFPRP